MRRRWYSDPDRVDELVFLLSQSLDAEAADLLAEVLPGVGGARAARLLELTSRWKVPVSRAELVRLLADPQARAAAVKAAAHGPAEFAPLIRPFLDDPSVRGAAAMTLARFGDVASLGAVTALLETGDRAIPVALELLGDTSVVPAARARLDRAAPAEVEGLHRLLIALTGHDPVIPRGGERAAAIRAAWRRWDPAVRPEPRVEAVGAVDASRGTFVVTDGQGLVRVGYDDSGWRRSMRIGGRRAYDLGSICDTCETTLLLAGWATGPRRCRPRGCGPRWPTCRRSRPSCSTPSRRCCVSSAPASTSPRWSTSTSRASRPRRRRGRAPTTSGCGPSCRSPASCCPPSRSRPPTTTPSPGTRGRSPRAGAPPRS